MRERTPTPIYLWHCSLCGASHTRMVAEKQGYATVGHIHYLDTIDWDPDKEFGSILVPQGKGKAFVKAGEWAPGEDPYDQFPRVKKRFEDALWEWLDKGWMAVADVKEILTDFEED